MPNDTAVMTPEDSLLALTDVLEIWTFVLMGRKRFYSEAHSIPGPDELQSGLWISSVGHYRAKNHVQDPRIREDHLLVCCISGKGSYQLGDRRFLIEEGDFFACFPGALHEYACDEKVGWEIRWVHFSGDQASPLLDLTGLRISQPVLRVGRKRDMEHKLITMQDLLSHHREESALDATAVLYQLLLGLRHQTRAQQIRDLGIENALKIEPESVSEMAAACSLTRSHFSRKFRSATGVTPWRYIVMRRITRAKDLLSNTALSIKEVAIAVGFHDPNYFSRLFHQETGLTPTEFRSQRVRRIEK